MKKSFAEIERQLEERDASGQMYSEGDDLVGNVNVTTKMSLTLPNLVIFGNRQMTLGHALEIILSELSRDKAIAMFSMQEKASF